MLGITPTEKTIILLQILQYKEIILKGKERGTGGKRRKSEEIYFGEKISSVTKAVRGL